MYRKLALILLLAFIATLIGCTKFYYQSPYAKFKHEQHVDILFQQQKDCFYCHKLPDIETIVKQGGEIKMTSELKIDGKCHTCHKDQATKVAKAPQSCDSCHENMKIMKPDDHSNNWTELHAAPAAADSKDCESCHKEWYCESCHTNTVSTEALRHSRSFKLTHSTEAYIDPGSCDSCHQISYCMSCHDK